MKRVVFLGPSLSRSVAHSLVDAVFMPPVRAGDIVRALADKPDVIGIVDGYFDRVPSVWHKEILYALSQGVAVYGAASMGALRAVELHAFGMIGVGRIFEAFRDGLLEDDDEVAIAHAGEEHDYRPASDAMVNIRMGIARASSQGLIGSATAAVLVDRSKARFYADRSWRVLLDDARSIGMPTTELAALTAFVAQERPDQKRDDAVELLQRLAEHDPVKCRPGDLEFHPTAYWQRLLEETEPGGAGNFGSSTSALATWLRVRSGGRSDVLREAALLYLISEASELLNLRVSDAQVDRARALFQDRGIDDADLEQLAAAEAILETLQTTRAPLVDNFVRLALTKLGALKATQDGLDLEQATLRDRGFGDADLTRAGLTTADLLAWYASRVGLAEGPKTPETLANRLGLPPQKMLAEILRWYLQEH